MDLDKLYDDVMAIDSSIRYVAIQNNLGEKMHGGFKEGISPILNVDELKMMHYYASQRWQTRKNIERGEWAKIVSSRGGQLNANTTQDRTYYYVSFPSNNMELGLWLESERLMHAKIEQIGVETQREVVKEEKRQRYDNQPYGSFIIEILKNAYKVHPYQEHAIPWGGQPFFMRVVHVSAFWR